MKKVMVFGTFDTLHPGHEFVLKEAKRLGDHLVVVVARDSTVKDVKKHETQHEEKQRVKNLEKLMLADKVILGNEGQDKYEIIRTENPDIIALGYDQIFFIEGLNEAFPSVPVVRIQSFKPDIYHSSILREKEQNLVE